MIKNSDLEKEELRHYYSYLKIILNINQCLACESPDKLFINVR